MWDINMLNRNKGHDTTTDQMATSCLSQLEKHVFIPLECQWAARKSPKVILHTTDTRHVLAVSYRIRQAVVLARKIGLWRIYFNLMCQQVAMPCRKTGIRGQLHADPRKSIRNATLQWRFGHNIFSKDYIVTLR